MTSVMRLSSVENTFLLEKEIAQIVVFEILASNFLHSLVQSKQKCYKFSFSNLNRLKIEHGRMLDDTYDSNIENFHFWLRKLGLYIN